MAGETDAVFKVVERMEGESKKAYAAFREFLVLPVPRSMGQLAEKLGLASPRQLGTWASKFKWRARAAEYDAHKELIVHGAIVERSIRAAVDPIVDHELEVYRVQLIEDGAALREVGRKCLVVANRSIDAIIANAEKAAAKAKAEASGVKATQYGEIVEVEGGPEPDETYPVIPKEVLALARVAKELILAAAEAQAGAVGVADVIPALANRGGYDQQ